MARALTRTVTLADGTTLTLTANMNTFADYEELTGKAMAEPDKTMRGARDRIWAFLHQAHPDLTTRDVGNMLAPGDPDFECILGAIQELAEAMNPPAAGATPRRGRP